MVRSWVVEFYKKENGEVPVKEFLDTISDDLRRKTLREISLLQEFGNKLREPYSKHLENGIFELRIKFASNISRVLYFFCIDNVIILTNGFIKKTQKTPPQEIEKAVNYKKDYERRYRK
ncbi:MAG: type II toxin-antitoxin system RelE/ParE family toxin [Firmicutes bacterium]|nr:type II toxin-antitoxin system RelE/ParE family toxin [Bacillota bacterium]